MTWGQMRLALRKEYPQVDVELFNAYLQEAYSDILGEREWAGLEASLVITTLEPYSTGTVTATKGSTTLAGVGTAWTVDMIGRKLRVGIDTDWYRVSNVDTELSLLLDRVYSAETIVDEPHEIFQDIYPLPVEVRQIDSITSPWIAAELNKASENDMIRTDAGLAYRGSPVTWAPSPDTSELVGQQMKQIRVWPVPDAAYQLVVDYTKSVFGFDGTNTEQYPIGFVVPAAILSGARSLCCMNPLVKDFAAADRHAALREAQLASMRQMDAARRSTTRLTVRRQLSTQDRDDW